MFNKSYVWTTLADHITRTDDEIIQLCGVNLVFIGPTEYGILCNIRQPAQSILVDVEPKPTTAARSKSSSNKKTTCHEGIATKCKREWAVSKSTKQTKSEKRVRTLSESRSQNYGITPPINLSTRTLRSGLQPVDYLSLNDGLDEEPLTNSKKRKQTTHRPRSTLLASRVAAQKNTTSPEAKDSDTKSLKPLSITLSAIPSTSTANNLTVPSLTGVLTPLDPNNLPDLVGNREASNPEPDTSKTADPVSTEEEMDAIDALLSLGDVREDTLDEDDNLQLMPIGAPSNIVDTAPVPVRLDQLNIDTAIADILQTEELEQQNIDNVTPDETNVNKLTDEKCNDGKAAERTTDDRPKSASPMQGSLKIKMHALKKKADSKRKYKCSVCGVLKASMHLVNEHHLKKHKPQICPVCGCTFVLASSLIRHAYDHEKKWYKCDACDYASHFESELKVHKIVHRKNPAFQCMFKNCRKWCMRKWELTVHIKVFKCDTCDFTTNLEKQLKEHQRKHSDDCAYQCKTCNKGFHYRSGLKRHRDHEHKE